MTLVNLRRRYACGVAAAAITAAAFSAPAVAQNVTVPQADTYTLLLPFLNLGNTAAAATLAANMSAAIATNNAPTTVIEGVAISDKAILNSASNNIIPRSSNTHTAPNAAFGTGPVDSVVAKYGPGANIGGGLPVQNIQDGTVNKIINCYSCCGNPLALSAIWRLGPVGTAFQAAVDPNNANKNTALENLLVNAYANFTSPDVSAKNYFANGTTNGATPIVLPSGYPNLPTTVSGASNSVFDKYYLAHGYSYNATLGQPLWRYPSGSIHF